LIALVAAAGVGAFAEALVAQKTGLTRTVVQRADASFPGYEVVVSRTEVAPGSVAGWHTHPGDEIDYVLEGEAELLIAGQPPRRVAAGDSFVIPAGTVHDARNSAGTPVKVIGVFIVDKTKRLASPAPAPTQ
jgi:quercetin dioxygenase-like cupin family protein